MPTESSDARGVLPDVVPAHDEAPATSRARGADASGRGRPSRHRRPRRTWVEGGTSVRRWGYDLLGWALISYGVGVLGALAVPMFVSGPLSGVLSSLVLWVGMAVAILLAFSRSIPRALLKFRWLDVLYGIVLGGILRIAQGSLEVAGGGSGALPSYTLFDGALPPNFWLQEILAPVVVSPLLEEFFFHGVLLVAVYTVTRRALGKGVAGFVAIIVTTGLFVASHSLGGAMSWDQAVTLLLVGAVCGLLALLTGRIWGAVLTHMTFNGLYVLLLLAGTALA